jgi:hypothetical protein
MPTENDCRTSDMGREMLNMQTTVAAHDSECLTRRYQDKTLFLVRCVV